MEQVNLLSKAEILLLVLVQLFSDLLYKLLGVVRLLPDTSQTVNAVN